MSIFRTTALVAFAFAFAALAPMAQAQDEVPVQVSDVSGETGDEVSVDVRLDNLDEASDITSYGFDIEFDESVVSYQGFDIEGTLSGQADEDGWTIDDNPDVPRIGAFGSSDEPLNQYATDDGRGVLITLNFQIDSGGSTEVRFTSDAGGLRFNDGTPAAVQNDPDFQIIAADDLLSVPDVSAVSGNTITVPVNATGFDDGIGSYGFDLTYDDAVLDPVGVVTDGSISEDFNRVDGEEVSPGTFRVGGSNSDSTEFSGTTPLVFVEFDVTDSERSALSFGDAVDTEVNGETTGFATKDGSVDARNAVPSVSALSDVTIGEDASTTVDVTVTDSDDPIEEVDIEVSSSNTDLIPGEDGTLDLSGTGSDRTLTLAPSSNENGSADITVTATDPAGASGSSSFTLTVELVRDGPIARDDSFSVPDGKNDTLDVTANDGVLENDTHPDEGGAIQGVNTSPIQEAGNGTVNINANGSFRYVPDEGFTGEDTFVYEITDGDSTDTATVEVFVAQDPVANPDTFETTAGVTASVPAGEGTLHTAQLTAFQNGGNGGFGGGSSPGTGDARLTLFTEEGSATLGYEITLSGLDYSTFADEFDGTDSVEDDVVGFHIHNAARGNNGGVVFGIIGSITEEGAVFDPSATDDEDREVTVDNDAGTVQISGSWDPGEGAMDPADFASAIQDADEGDDVPLYLNVHTGTESSESRQEGEIRGQIMKGPSVAGVLANDGDASFGDDRVEDDVLTASVVDDVSNGTLSLNEDGSFTYEADDGFTGEDSFTYEADDGDQATDQATVTINVEPVNNPPFFTTTAPEDTADAFVGQTFEQQFGADPGDEDDSVTYSLESSVSNASIDSETGLFTFTPSEDQVGQTFTFEVRAEDEGGLAAAQSFDVEVREVLLGDVTGNGEVSAFDATRVLQAAAGQSPPRPLSDRDSTAADVTADGSISALDASAILRFVVGDIDSFSEVQNGGGSSEALATTGSADLTWGEPSTEKSRSILPVRLENSGAKVYSISITLQGDLSNVATDQITTALPDGWQSVKAERAGDALEVVMAGATPLTESQEVVRLPLQSDDVGELGVSGTASLNEGEAAQIEGLGDIDTPDRFSFLGNYPNPVAQSTSITFNLPEDASVKVSVYDVLGREVRSVTREMAAGAERTVRLQADGLSSGMYLLRVEASSGDQKWTDSGRMVVSK